MTEPFTQPTPAAASTPTPTSTNRPWLTIVLAVVAAVARRAAGGAFKADQNEK
jgi:hypothetical protein